MLVNRYYGGKPPCSRACNDLLGVEGIQLSCGHTWPHSASPHSVEKLAGYEKTCKANSRAIAHFHTPSPMQMLDNPSWMMLNIEESLASLEHMADLPSVDMFICLLHKCRKSKSLAFARRVHTCIQDRGLEVHEALGNHLVPLFVDCGSMPAAQQVFHKLVLRNEYSWTSIIQGYIECGEPQHAFDLFQKMQEDNASPSLHTYVSLLKACARLKRLTRGQEIHTEIAKEELENDPFVSNTLVDMYAKCGSLDEAREVFERLPVQNVLSWTTIIAGYAEHGLNEEALLCWEEMELEAVLPDAVTFVCILKACGSMKAVGKGREIHNKVVEEGLEKDRFVGNSLVDLYAKCGLLSDAQEVFDELSVPDVVSFTELIIGYAEYGSSEEALNCLEHMQAKGVLPDAVTYVCGMKACGSTGAVDKGRELHVEVIKEGFESQPAVGCTLVDMYAKCGLLVEAQGVFDELLVQNVFSWTALITGYVEHELNEEALKCLQQMKLEGKHPDAVTLVCSIKACDSLRAIDRGQEIHGEIVQEGFEGDPFVGSSLMGMYAECGLLLEAREVFDELLVRDVVAWNALIAGYAEHGLSEDVMNLLDQMQREGVPFDTVTFVCSLKACSSIGAIERGLEIHNIIAKGVCELDSFVASALVDMYAKYGFFAEAQQVFDKVPARDVVLWSALIVGYSDYGLGEEALSCFKEMQHEGLSPNAVTYLGSLRACGSIEDMDRGREIHAETVKKGCENDSLVSSALVGMYASCGWLTEAQEVFDELSDRDVVPWTALMAGYAKHELVEEALNCLELMQLDGMSPDEFSWSTIILGYAEQGESEKASLICAQMQEQGIPPSSMTFLSILKAHGNAAALEIGKRIHTQVYRNAELELNGLVMETALIGMYGKCGSMVDAQLVFDEMLRRDLVGWNALITEYARQGECELVTHMFEKMQEEGIQPDKITFLNLLSVCNHVGLVGVGYGYFEFMSNKYGIIPTNKHHNCFVDLLCRAGQFDEAIMMIGKLPSQPDLVAWSTVLGSCQRWGNVEAARQAFESAICLDETHAATFILMSNIYADALGCD